MSTEKVKLTVAQVKEDLANGLDRKAIGEKYGLNGVNIKALFQHPELKGLKVKTPKTLQFELVDDTAPTATESVAAQEVTAPTPDAEVETKAEEVTTTKGVW